ncbi:MULTISPECIES: hypothetical protein [Pseudomonas]|uniref:Uncharacterized protein n=1 Tax=Pseudomonas quercus TaxID=2722792 RepID=A0ABX0YGE4_9PSED|nr:MULTISPECIES: hypothetical protein [Pseudomonas]MBF7142726.1 hypothetical protein [Pseudomonas sp. LY10J]NJP01264.1 hypothetical protein [Pseudomonas quercus]
MIVHTVPAFEWGRAAHPKLSVYFDNPKTGEGAPESGALMRYATLVAALRNLDGVTDGFVEIENFNSDILEILSPADGVYTVIYDRRDECQHSFADTLKALSRFCGMDSGRPPK